MLKIFTFLKEFSYGFQLHFEYQHNLYLERFWFPFSHLFISRKPFSVIKTEIQIQLFFLLLILLIVIEFCLFATKIKKTNEKYDNIMQSIITVIQNR